MARTGILLLNFGGPETLAEVKPFLLRLFDDRYLLPGVPGPLRRAFAWAIAVVKGPGSRRAYEAIGGGSPQLRWTRTQAEALEKSLAGESIPVALGMRASEPSIERGLQELRTRGVDRILLLPMFPQYSTTTTASCFDAVERARERLDWRPEMLRVERWPDHPAYVALLRKTLDEALVGAPAGTHVFFSAHSLPLSVVRRGDPYPADIAKTVEALARGLTLPWTLVFQSRNGPMRWLEPYIEDAIPELARKGVRSLVVVPIAFVSDHIETLWELDRLYADLARSHGIEHYARARSFNGDPEFTAALAAIARGALNGGAPS